MYMPVLIFFAVLDLRQKSSFMDRHLLVMGWAIIVYFVGAIINRFGDL